MATASLVLGIVGVATVGGFVIPSVLAVIFGHQEVAKIKMSNGQRGGRRHAIAGLILGYVGIGLGVLTTLILASGFD